MIVEERKCLLPRRTADIKEKKHHIPVVDRTPLEPPPIVVAVVGPPKVGKTTLVRCLVKNFTQQNLAAINGPVTLVSGNHSINDPLILVLDLSCISF